MTSPSSRPFVPSEMTKVIGLRVGYARHQLNLSQEQLSKLLGFADRQTLSSIEKGERRVQPNEILKISEILRQPWDWFLDPFIIAGESNFSWCVSSQVSRDELETFEQISGAWIGMIRFLRREINEEDEPFKQDDPFLPVLRIDSTSSPEDAIRLGEQVGAKLDLGNIPASQLSTQIQSKLDIPVLFLNDRPALGDFSSALCKMRDLRVILLNGNETPALRNAHLSRTLFHALTWDALPPPYRKNNDLKNEKTKSGKSAALRIERLAHYFSIGLLMPSWILEFLDRDCCQDIGYLARAAHFFEVSYSDLGLRLLHAKMIERPVFEAFTQMPLKKETVIAPKQFSTPFVQLVHSGIKKGHVSERKAAKTLGMTLEQLTNLFEEHKLLSLF